MDEVTRILIFTTIFTLSAVVLLLLSFTISRRRQLQHKKQLLEKEFKTRVNALLQVSRDLHDDIGSSLSGINMLSQHAQQQLAGSNINAAADLLLKINNYTSEVIEKVSDMAWLLKPNQESLFMLTGKIKAYAQSAASSKNISIHFDADPEAITKELSIQERKAIYLISKEAINNSIKYSGCKNIYYHLSSSSQSLKLLIRDDGQGFLQAQGLPGNGLINMKERAREINGHLDIKSDEEKGTIVILEL